MRGKGISYDTGFLNKGTSSRPSFEPDVVRRELQIIRDDLHCNLVRVTGGDPDRLELAAKLAAEAGLEVWFSPFTCDLNEDEMLQLLADCAARAERLRQTGVEVVFVTGAELSILNNGFLPGEHIGERLKLLNNPSALREHILRIPARINAFLARALRVARERFAGKVTYASVALERVDWTPFDIISVDLYRGADNAQHFDQGLRALVALGKPVAITEFGSATYRGAADLGARAGFCIVWDEHTAEPLRLDGEYERDELEQAQAVRAQLQAFEAAGVDTAIVFTFASYNLPHRSTPIIDLDRGSYAVVKTLEQGRGDTYPDLPWEPKAAFAAVAEHFGDERRGTTRRSQLDSP